MCSNHWYVSERRVRRSASGCDTPKSASASGAPFVLAAKCTNAPAWRAGSIASASANVTASRVAASSAAVRATASPSFQYRNAIAAQKTHRPAATAATGEEEGPRPPIREEARREAEAARETVERAAPRS